MVKIASYVFFDLETTGLPHLERNKTKIIELSFVAALRKHLENADVGSRPYVNKLTFMLNPQKRIMPDVVRLTGITDDMIKKAPIFKDKVESIISFLNELPKPVCLVAHNGNKFDFKIFLAELKDIEVSLPSDLLCADSLIGFRRIHKKNWPKVSSNSKDFSFEDSRGSEDWPDLNITPEDWDDIDILCTSFSDIGIYDSSHKELHNCHSKTQSVKQGQENEKILFKLTDIYKRLLKKEIINAHRAEDDCMMLLECVVAAKEFLIWADKYSKNINDITPLQRKL